ncbi:hypothetical protein PsorP6_013688 [Peronosclerospora sorghi]|uniref:Uncharacterized protein n=1 Tax=Peronosclerospora sorghi TaxID=230839 RepID=A0ACC0VI10_9STRA|nr:hypothetical protein PsorP6_013688 [Peronosclerospora sorghi]
MRPSFALSLSLGEFPFRKSSQETKNLGTMSHFVRQSKFRHVYIEPAKLEFCYTNVRLATATGEQNYIKGNTKFFAVSIQAGGGAMAVVPYDRVGKFDPDFPLISGHRGAILDFDFNPFHEHLIASASDDTTIKIWGIPEGGLTESCVDPLVDLRGHGRKVTLIKFHPTANNVLASTSSDFTDRLWDIEKGAEIVKMEEHGENLVHDLAWSWTGSLLGTTCKDKVVRLYDARSGQIAAQKENAHMGTKSVKMAFLGSKETFVTVGFTRQSQRQFKVWDPRNLEKELKKVDIDQAAGAIMPFYDQDTNLLYLCGKGDGNIRYYEMSEGEPYAFPLSEYRSTTSAKGMAMIPKRGCDIMKCETARLLKLTLNAIEPLHVFVPRKSDAFQDDIFPDTYAGIPSMSADEWLGGADNSPVLMSLRPEMQGKITSDGKRSRAASKTNTMGSGIAARVARFARGGSKSDNTPEGKLKSELEAANARIAQLEKLLRENGISY